MSKCCKLGPTGTALGSASGSFSAHVEKPLKRIRPSTVRGPAAVKCKDPKTGQTWSGNGQLAAWLKAALKDGKKLEDFAV